MKRTWQQNMKKSPALARTSPDGILFASKLELRRWMELKLWERAGAIRNLRRQVRFALETPDADGPQIKVGAARTRTGAYTADFVYEIHDPLKIRPHIWLEVIEDVKPSCRKSGKLLQSASSKLRISVFESLTGKKVSIVTVRQRRWVTL